MRRQRPWLLLAALAAASALAEDAHPAAARGVWLQVTPLELSFAPASVDPLSFLPWLPFVAGADVGPLTLGIGFGVRPLARDVLVLASPVLRWQVATPVRRLAVLLEARLHAGVATGSGLAFGVGALAGVEVFLSPLVSLSPGLGVDYLAGASGGSRPDGGGAVLSLRAGVNFTL